VIAVPLIVGPAVTVLPPEEDEELPAVVPPLDDEDEDEELPALVPPLEDEDEELPTVVPPLEDEEEELPVAMVPPEDEEEELPAVVTPLEDDDEEVPAVEPVLPPALPLALPPVLASAVTEPVLPLGASSLQAERRTAAVSNGRILRTLAARSMFITLLATVYFRWRGWTRAAIDAEGLTMAFVPATPLSSGP
jgi:hypothetical protein